MISYLNICASFFRSHRSILFLLFFPRTLLTIYEENVSPLPLISRSILFTSSTTCYLVCQHFSRILLIFTFLYIFVYIQAFTVKQIRILR